MEKKLKKAINHVKEAVRIIIKEDWTALYAIYTAFKGFSLIPVYIKTHFNEPYFQRNLKMAKKMFTLTIGVLLLACAAYIIAEEIPYQDRPVQQQRPLQRDQALPQRPLAEGRIGVVPEQGPVVRPAQPIQSLSAWFEAVKQAYNAGNEQRLGTLIQRMNNILAQEDEATRGRPVVQAFERWFTQFKNAHQIGESERMGLLINRYEQTRNQVRGGIQQQFGQPQQERPLLPAGPQARIRGGEPLQPVPPAGQPGASYGRGRRGGQDQPLAPQGPAQRGARMGRGQPLQQQAPVGPRAGLGRGGRIGARPQLICPHCGKPIPPRLMQERRGWGWRIDIRPLPPPRRFQQQQGFQGEPLQPQMRRGMGRGMGPAGGGQFQQSPAPVGPQRRGMLRRGIAPQENLQPVQPPVFDWN